MERSNNIYIGRKPVMSYCLACMTAMQGDVKEINLMARGRAISKAVDVAEVLRNQYMKELTVKDISIGTETLETEEGGSRNISNITIVLAKE
jgi:DNA-binding protein